MTSNRTDNTAVNPLDVVSCTCAHLRQSTRVVTQAYDAALSPVGIRSTQFTVIAALTMMGGVPLTRLAEALVMDRTTLTRNLKPLIAKGLVRIQLEADQRVRRVHLTAKGRKIFDSARPLWEEAQARMVDRLGKVRWAGFLDDLAATLEIATAK